MYTIYLLFPSHKTRRRISVSINNIYNGFSGLMQKDQNPEKKFQITRWNQNLTNYITKTQNVSTYKTKIIIIHNRVDSSYYMHIMITSFCVFD